MNKRQHLLNGLVVAIGLTIIRVGAFEPVPLVHLFGYLLVPILLGTLLPDIDTEYGKHRKSGHNLFVLGGMMLYPFVFGNLYALWIGVAVHLTADMALSDRGCALLYPFSTREWSLPGTAPRTSTIRTISFSFLCVAQLAALYTLVMVGLYP